MTILTLIIVICLIVLCFWAVNTYVSPPIIKTILNVVLVIICIGFLLHVIGWMPNFNSKL